MKLVALWLAVLALAATTATSCSVSHRSGDFACETQADCSNSRTCIDGFCVSTRPPDAGIEPPDAAALCPSQCTSCDRGLRTCTIDCALDGDLCNRPISCPEGWHCNIACSTRNACNSGVDCGNNSNGCDITCGGAQSCRSLSLGAQLHTVDCRGNGSCRDVTCAGLCNINCGAIGTCDSVDCTKACACDVDCSSHGTCAGVTCTSDFCTGPFGDCTSFSPPMVPPETCNSCLL